MDGCPVSAIGDSEQWTQLKGMALGDAKFYRKENDFFASLFFFLQFVDVPFAAEWRSCNFWTSKCAHCFPRAEHLRHYGNTALGDTLGLQTKKAELPRQPLSSPYYPFEGRLFWDQRVEEARELLKTMCFNFICFPISKRRKQELLNLKFLVKLRGMPFTRRKI
ncbi:hypothetical protein V1478_005834 [Vespula squamosa]|uniref:Uncharacterized protein n=1 Tax=Vespula squamosa TaxID=30214 RepID=A0ABD2B9Y6_VESSQ